MRERPFDDEPIADVALTATLKAAAIHQKSRKRELRMIVKSRDLRRRLREKRAGYAVLFVIDASASMRSQDRMVRVKGMIRCFLDEMYVHKDRVAIVAFRHAKTELALPFTRNLSKAAHCLSAAPVGGKTPLADGLELAFKTLRRERYQNPQVKPVLALFSDGKPNASLNGLDPLDETFEIAYRIRRNRIQSFFIDTETNPLAFGYGPDIAHAMGGLYINIGNLLKD